VTGGANTAGRCRPTPGAKAAATLLALAAVCQPLAARVLGEMDPTASFVLPTVIFVVALCMLVPRQFMPELTLAVTYLAEGVLVFLRDRPFGRSPLRRMLAGDVSALAVPAGAAVLGHMIVWVLRNRRLWRWGGKTNLRLLLRRPGVLVRAYRWPIVVTLIGTTLDTITTMRAMYANGVAAELHPAMRAIAEEIGVTWGVPLASVMRLAFVAFVAAFWRRWCGWLLLVAGVGYALAAASNYFGWL